MLVYLPINLELLDISRAKVLCLNTPENVFATSPPAVAGRLAFLIAIRVKLAHWLPLVGFSSLRFLCMPKCTVTDIHLQRAYESWSRLHNLDLRTTSGMGSPVSCLLLKALRGRHLIRIFAKLSIQVGCDQSEFSDSVEEAAEAVLKLRDGFPTGLDRHAREKVFLQGVDDMEKAMLGLYKAFTEK